MDPVARPSRERRVAAASTPTWPRAWKRAWRVDVGEGYSSPVVADGRAFVHSRRDPTRLVTAIDLAPARSRGSRSTDAVQQEPVRDAACRRAARDAARDRRPRVHARRHGGRCRRGTRRPARWLAQGLLVVVDTSKLFTGTAASPLADGGSVDRPGRQRRHGGRVIALDPQTGAETLDVDRQGPGYASPVALTPAASGRS
jgi:hypothetical protein